MQDDIMGIMPRPIADKAKAIVGNDKIKTMFYYDRNEFVWRPWQDAEEMFTRNGLIGLFNEDSIPAYCIFEIPALLKEVIKDDTVADVSVTSFLEHYAQNNGHWEYLESVLNDYENKGNSN